MSHWTCFEIFPRHSAPRLPQSPGVYVIYIGGEIVYIGQSVNIRNRICGYNLRYGYSPCIHTPWGDYPAHTPIVAKIKLSKRLGDWAMWEIRLIARLKPMFNRHFKNRSAA